MNSREEATISKAVVQVAHEACNQGSNNADAGQVNRGHAAKDDFIRASGQVDKPDCGAHNQRCREATARGIMPAEENDDRHDYQKRDYHVNALAQWHRVQL